MIPNIIHFIYGLKSDFGGKEFSLIHFLAVVTAAKVNRPEKLYFHYAYEPTGAWWERAKPYLTMNKVVPPAEIFGRPLEHFAHQADVLRLEVLMQYGGIYLDMDVVCVNSFAPLMHENCVMGIQPGKGLCNAVILARPGSQFIRLWYEKYRDFDGRHWSYHSVALPMQLARQHPTLIAIQDEYSFFYPMYNDPTHADLWGTRPLWIQRLILQKIFQHVRVSIANACFSMKQDRPYPPLAHLLHGPRWQYRKLSRSYCIHLWESIWWNHLTRITPDTIRQQQGNLAKIVRKAILPEEML